MLVIFPNSSSLGTWGQPAALQGFPSSKMSLFPGLLSLLGMLPKSFSTSLFNMLACSPGVQGNSSAESLLTSPRNESSAISQLLCPRQAPIIPSPTSASVFANSKSGRAPSLAAFNLQLCQEVLFQTLWELFPLDCFLSTALYFQQTSGELKFPRRTRASDCKTSHSCSENILSVSASWLDVRDSQPGYLHCWPCP